jgi:cation transport ATPase
MITIQKGAKERSKGMAYATGTFRIPGAKRIRKFGRITQALYSIEGVLSVEINYISFKVHVDYDPRKVTAEKIRKAINETIETTPE